MAQRGTYLHRRAGLSLMHAGIVVYSKYVICTVLVHHWNWTGKWFLVILRWATAKNVTVCGLSWQTKAVAAMTLIDVVAEENVHFYCAEDRGRGQGSERLNVDTVGRAALAPNLCLKARAETV